MNTPFLKALRDSIEGEVRDDAISKAIYSVDASIYEIPPVAVALPKTKQEVLICIEVARHYGIPVIPRGAATGITGGCIGHGLVIDTSKYLNRISEINFDAEYACCEPGVVQNQLNNALAPHDYRLGPDTSTGNRATLGGMVANNAAGSRSLRYGKMSDHVQEVEVALYSGETIRFHAVDTRQLSDKQALANREGLIYREVMRIKNEMGGEIHQRYPSIPRRSSGYNLTELIKPGPLNLAKCIAGSEGSLGLITDIRVGICRRPQISGLCLIQCSSMEDAFSLVNLILPWQPLSLEMVDRNILSAGRTLPLTSKRVGWIEGDPAAVLIVEFDAPNATDLQKRLDDLTSYLSSHIQVKGIKILTDMRQMGDVWAVREAGVGLLLSKRSYSRAIAFLEDVTVSPESLAPFMQEFLALLARHGKDAGVYGHVGAGCMHIRPYINLREPAELTTMRHLMEETSDLLLKFHGSLTGEHGDGLVRSWLNEKMFGKKLYQAFIDLKTAFDPSHKMNPGKIVATQDLHDNLRLSPDIIPKQIGTAYDYSREGGFALSVDLCNGNGLCRKREGLMCPSFQAYGDEFHSTRARAQSLRAVVNGRLPAEAFTSHELYHVLEYCLECKGCKTECPSQIDMAKMKAEFLYHYQNKWGYSWRTWLFGNLPAINRFAQPFASLFNTVGSSWIGKRLLDAVGIASQRPLPPLTHQRFSKWLATHPVHSSGEPVVLFLDTFTEFHYPQIGQSAFRVLTALGYKVIVPPWHCCGRPLISKGMLDKAKIYAAKVIGLLTPYAMKGIPIIGLEPSCIFTLKDEYPDLVPSNAANDLAKVSVTLDTFLSQVTREQQDIPWARKANAPVYFHTHCHQKSLVGADATKQILLQTTDQVEEILSGCCGLAGSFGYEQEHYDFSMQIGENKLFPAVRKIPEHAFFVANGTSCRSQITHGVGRQALHLAELLDRLLLDRG